ncbi:MAG: hypothetical protein IPN34_03230 [Planctomycetes bacterium]|nr:hypothetical protein [Planctomycetota bacterium]
MSSQPVTRVLDLQRLSPLRRSALVAGTAVFLGAGVLAVAIFLLAVPLDRPRDAAGAAAGGALGLVIGAFVYCSWVAALLRAPGPEGSRLVWRSFGRGFAFKALVLVAGTAAVRYLLPDLTPAGFAVAFAAGALWVGVLGVPFLHRQLGSPRGL